MNVLYVGQNRLATVKSFCSNFKAGLKKAGYHVKYIVLGEYIKSFYNDEKLSNPFIRKIAFFKMSNLPKGFDVIFVEGINQFLQNDLSVDIKVVYFYKNLLYAFFVHKPDILLYRFPGSHNALLRVLYPNIYRDVKEMHPFFFAINPVQYEIKNKDIKGVSYVGPTFWIVKRADSNIINRILYHSHAKVVKYLKENEITGLFKEACNAHEYGKIFNRLQARIIIPADHSWESRVFYETAYMKTVMILYIQHPDASYIIKKYLHYGANSEYIPFSKPKELKSICENLESYDLDKIIQNASVITKTYHTYDKRVKQFIKIIEGAK